MPHNQTVNDMGIIDEPAVRVILLKVVVGLERSVYESYKTYLDSLESERIIINWWCYKIFGEYDLCFIIIRENFDHDMAFSGTIPGITYSTEMLCYLWGQVQETQEKSFRHGSFGEPLICMCMLKVKPPLFRLKRENIDIEFTVSALLEKLPRVFCLGSLGWCEFILLYPSASFQDVYAFIKEVHSHGYTPDIEQDENQMVGLFLKSFSLLGVNYDLLYPELKCKNLIKEKIRKEAGFHPSVLISCRPSEIEAVWKSACAYLKPSIIKKNPTLTFGSFDFIFDVKRGSWGGFIDNLIELRENHKDSIFKTSVQIQGKNVCVPTFKKAWKFEPKVVKIESDAAKKLGGLGHPAQETILSTIYTFNQYLQNELVADSVEDMVFYISEMGVIALKDQYVRLCTEEVLKHLEHMPENIKYGSNQRLGGFLLQEGADDFSPFKGGKHRLAKALKALCMDIFQEMKFQWKGFVLIGRRYEYNHLGGILDIPVDAAFRVDEYWGLFHEICHVYLLYNDVSFAVDEELPTEKVFSKKRDLYDKVRASNREVFCELFDFQLGFLGDFDLFINTLLPYLSRIINSNRFPIQGFEQYASRLLSVILYHKNISEKDYIEDHLKPIAEELAQRFLKYIETPDEIKRQFDKLVNNMTYNAICTRDTVALFKAKLTEWKDLISQRRDKLLSKKFRDQFQTIMEGKIVSDLEHPQLVVLAMRKERVNGLDIPFKAHIAAILSFLNCYYRNKWDTIHHLYKSYKTDLIFEK